MRRFFVATLAGGVGLVFGVMLMAPSTASADLVIARAKCPSPCNFGFCPSKPSCHCDKENGVDVCEDDTSSFDLPIQP